MQSLYPLVTADFTAKAHQPVNKLELFIECCAYDLCDFYGKNYLIEAYYSSGQRELSYCPVAAEFTAIIDATDGLLHPKNTDSPFYSYLKVGRKIIFHTGFKKDGIDYLWQWFEGIISDVQINNSANQITIRGFDYTQYLTEVKLKSPDNYWGAVKNTVTVADQADYDLSGLGCNGAYIAYLDGVQIYNGDTWIYDEGTEKFWFLPSSIPVANDIPLIIYYYTTQVPENVVADLLVTAGLYPTQAAALANMDYTATGVDDDIDRVRFNTGVSVLYAIQKICERIDYEFYFKHDGTPVFKPIATVGASSFTFGKELVGTFDYIENIDEVRNHIIIEGEEYSIYDELYRILDGTEIMYTLDDIPDGDPVTGYGRMKMTSITAGKIIIAGCQAEVTNQMFTTPEARNNVEAWKHAGDVTLIDGGNIYTGTVILDKLSTSRSPNLLKSKYSDFQSFEDEGSLGYVERGTAKCDTADFYIGDRCLRMVATDTDNYVYLALNIDDYNIRLKPSTKYIVSFYAKADAGTPQVRGFIKQDDTTQKIPALQFITTSWVRYKFIIETDAGLTDSGLLGIGNYTDGATVWFDAIQVEEASAAASPEASPYKPSGTVEIHGGQIEARTIVANDAIVLNSITVGEVDFDAQLFTSGTEKTNIENWIKADHPTYIDGERIYTRTIAADRIIANSLTVGEIDFGAQLFTDGDAKTDIEAWRHASNLTLIDGGNIYTGTITTGKLSFTPYVIGTNTLDNIANGTTYGRVLNADMSAGHILLSSTVGNLDDIANGATYGKVALTGITAGKIIVAGLDSGVTARMFLDSATKTNIEAWRHASDVTLIDGGDIYADSILLGSIKSDAFSSLANRNLIKNSAFDRDASLTEEPTFWDLTSWGTFLYHMTYSAGEGNKKYPWDFVYYVYQEAVNNDGAGHVVLIGSEFIPIDRDKPYTLSLWIKKYTGVIKWYLGLNFYDSDKVACAPADAAYPASMNAITDTPNTYTHYSGTFGPNADDYDVAFPADCRYVKIRFFPIYNPAAGQIASSMATGLQFEPGDHVTDWKPHMIPEDWVHASDVTMIDGGDIYTGTVILDKLSTSRNPNLIKSKYSDFQSFEDEDNIGSGVPTGTAKCDTTAFYVGDRCLKMIAAAAGDNYAFLGTAVNDYNIRLKPSTKYIVSFYAAGAPGTPSVVPWIRQDNGVDKSPGASQTVTGAWIRHEFIITTDSNLTQSGILVIYNMTASATAWFDAIQVEEASAAASPEASPYKPSGTVEIHGGQIEAETLLVDRLVVGSDANTEDTLDVYQGEGDTQIFRLRSTSINHQITQGGGLGYDWGTYTDCYFYMRKENAAQGGMHCASFTEASHDISYQLYAIYGTGNKAKTSAATGAINLAGLRGNPTDGGTYPHGYQDCEEDDNIFCLKTMPAGGSYQAVFIVDEKGDIYFDGAVKPAFQDEDDIELVKELEDILSSRISKAEMKQKDVFKKHKIVHVNEVDEIEHGKEGKLIKTGGKRLDRFISSKKLNMLLIGSIRQLNEKIEKLEAKI